MKNGKKKLSLLLTAALLVSAVQIPGNAESVKLKKSSDANQMVSEEELIYLSTYRSDKRTQNFDSNWKFYFGESENAWQTAFDDASWENISIPHDYSITQEFSKTYEAESGYLGGGIGWYRKNFSVPDAAGKRVRIDFGGVYMNATVYVNGHKVGTHPYGYTSFSFDITDYLLFDQDNVIAVRAENKIPSSRWYSGSGIYRSVELTITDPVHIGLYGTKVETPNLESEQGDAVTVEVSAVVENDGDAPVDVVLRHSVIPKGASEGENGIGTTETAPVTVMAGQEQRVMASLQASNPVLWSLSDPALYLLRTEVVVEGQTADVYDTEFGFRYLDFDTDTGFSLNGERMKLKGVCMHHDQGALGAAAYYRAMERQVELLKEMGCNAIRVTHNPSDRTFMEICNEKGMLVIQEVFDTWHNPKNGNVNDSAMWFNTAIEEGNTIIGGTPGSMTWAEFDVSATVKRDYNDPSAIMWSLGNEVMEGISAGIGDYPATAQTLIDWTVAIDDTRPVTTGDNKLKGAHARDQAIDISNRLTAAGGTVGFNYTAGGSGMYQLDYYHQTYPDWLMYGAETASAINSRGIYYFRGNGSQDKQRTAYDESRVGWGHVASDAWYTVATRDFMAGEFVWTGFDYIGEPTPWNGTGPGAVGDWPSPKSSYFGMIDTAGFPKDSFYFYQSQWNEEVDTLHILPAWNEDVVYKESGDRVKVVVYSDAPSVELFFTPQGSDMPQSLGRKTFTEKTTAAGTRYQLYEGEGKSGTEHENLYLTWMVPYADGTITAKAYEDGTGSQEITGTVGRSYVTTTGAAAKLSALADRDTITADGSDLAYITVDVTDEAGNLIPNAADRITFAVEGNGELVGVDNGNAPDHDSYQADNRRAFSGKVLAIVRSTEDAGGFTLTASAEGLESASVEVQTEAVSQEPGQDNEIHAYQMSRNYYVKTGTMPELPQTVRVYYRDGTEAELPVIWEEIEEESIQQPGYFAVNGLLEGGVRITLHINMIEEIAALLNYSTAVQVGGNPALPAARPAVMEDGTILNVQLPVVWEEEDQADYLVPGMVTRTGHASAFGKDLEVTANIRVSEEEITIGNNVAPNVMRLEQDVPEGQQSDTLQAIIDGSTALNPNNDGGTNPSCWTNWAYSQTGQTKSEITFTYATAERLGQAVVHFFEDSASARIPSKVELFYSREESEEGGWIEIPVSAETGTQTDRVTPVTYTFDAPVEAVVLKLAFTNSTEILGNGMKPCTGITEVELNRAVGNFTVHSDAKLAALTVNGMEVSQASLNQGSYSTPALIAETVEAEAKNNGAVTVLPVYDDTIRILVESEDHSRRAQFLIQLDGEVEQSPEDDSRDYDRTKTTATAENSQQSNGLTPDMAVDGDESTLWHTRWNYITPEEDRWLLLELVDAVKLDALRYLPKDGTGNGDNNGRIGKYRVEVSEDGSDWVTVSEGNWPDQPGWKLAVFDEEVTAKYVKLWGAETYGDEAANKYVNAAEVRVREALPTIDLAAAGQVTMEDEEYELVEEGMALEPAVSVTIGGQTLKYGLDYKVSYENNTVPGTAAVLVKGILAYSGTIRKEFTILEKGSQEVSVAGGRITHIDNQPYDGGSEVKVAPGHLISIEADPAPEGKTFRHWRVIPENTEIIGSGNPQASLLVPAHPCRLIAMYQDEDGSMGSAEAMSRSVPVSWFAYGAETDLEIILAEVLTEEDRDKILDGAGIEVVLTIERSEHEPALSSAAPYGKATPSNANFLEATPSDADRIAALTADMGDGDKIGFYLNTSLDKTTNELGSSVTEPVNSQSGAEITFQLPQEDRDMKDYRILLYSSDGEELHGEIIPEVQEDLMSFTAGTNDAYVLMYTLCHTVQFVDYDGRLISEQRVAHEEAAEEPEEPYRNGYRFVGWSREFQSVTTDLTVRALYEKDHSGEPDPDPTVDKTKLEEAILEKEARMANLDSDDYTDASWARLVQAVTSAKEIMEDEDASQNKVNQAVEVLEAAWNGLKKKSSYSGSSGGSQSSKTKRSIPVTRGEWSKAEQGWRFKLEDGSYATGQWAYIDYMGVKEWYYFGSQAAMQTGWLKDGDGNYYYLNPEDGAGIGRMQTGWKWITDKDGLTRCYYFQESSNGYRGKLYTGTTTPDGYLVNDQGQWIQDGQIQTKQP